MTMAKRPIPAELPARIEDEVFLNLKQAAAFLGVSLATVRRLGARGKLPVARLSERRVGVRVGALKALGGAR